MDFIKIAYVAGVIDGEGSITLAREKKHNFRRPRISISSCDLEIIQPAVDLFGGSITAKKSKQKEHHLQAYEWRLYGRKALKALCVLVHYMKSPNKIARSWLLIQEYDSVTQRNGKYNEQQMKEKLDFEHRFLSINSGHLTEDGYHPKVKT